MTKKVNIYTDGSSIGNPGPGGYGIIMVLENNAYKKEVSQGFSLTTNNRMELLAVIVALAVSYTHLTLPTILLV